MGHYERRGNDLIVGDERPKMDDALIILGDLVEAGNAGHVDQNVDIRPLSTFQF